jgi:hypothetical protein
MVTINPAEYFGLVGMGAVAPGYRANLLALPRVERERLLHGNWKIRPVSPPARGKRDFEYYAAKDRLMAEEGSIGFMLWDGKSRGTLANVFRLMEQGKKVVVYLAPTKQFTTLRNMNDWNQFSRSPHGRVAPQESLVELQRRGSREYSFF